MSEESKRITRRRFLQATAVTAVAALVQACAQQTPAPVAPTKPAAGKVEPTKPAAAAGSRARQAR